ncbi:hypothetical protein D8B24_02380 [Verminephrobacter aporrectodeae subsp. tuberculatae]|uniref:hypothetical protein n=1 Tax=Verminephrobacter aporrectodeae TaxID=1110389 RepID=UPI002243CA7C|nr:hypothetical protein [Verminephrobacter aporrectodeae]MCW8205926.1 hypothetical protein [Verminephrobacter aporrectodeae subsp. tuberculatae]
MKAIVADLLRGVTVLMGLVMGLVFFLSLLTAALVLALVWALRAGWARLTGRPATPWGMRVDPRTGFGSAFRATRRWSWAARTAAAARDETAARRSDVPPEAGGVTDVEPRELR